MRFAGLTRELKATPLIVDTGRMVQRPVQGRPPRKAREFERIVLEDASEIVLGDVRAVPKKEGGGYSRDLCLMDKDGACLMIECRGKFAGKLKLTLF